jgi:L-alanine-DL-glutamate epimerase-like enolase superfamily enzyme
VGIGEAAPFFTVSGETQDSAAAAVAECQRLVVGQDVRGLRRILPAISEACAEEAAARCAIEQALLDALLRHYRMPMWTFFGGHGTELLTDLTITASDRGHAERAARAAAEAGFFVLKVKVGAGGGAGLSEDVARLRAIHEAAPHARLILDANGGYTAKEALELLAEIEACKIPVALFEQPVARSSPLELLEVGRRSRVPVCADESARSVADVRWLAESGAVRAINLKLMKTGLFETLAMYELARSAGLELMIGGMIESPLAMSMSAHLAAGLGGFTYVDLDTPLFIARHPFRGGFAQEGPRLRLGHVTAGHGVTVAAPLRD